MMQRINGRPSRPTSLLTIKTAAGRLGCSDSHIYRLIAAGHLRAVDISPPGSGRTKTRVRDDDLADYIERHTRGQHSPTGDAA
jgi:excisionase family DNA binding protein